MIWYALEILLVLSMIVLAIIVFQALVHSKRFARFVNRTVDVGGDIDVEIKLDRAEKDAEKYALNPTKLVSLIQEGIDSILDKKKWKARDKEEQNGRRQLALVADNWDTAMEHLDY